MSITATVIGGKRRKHGKICPFLASQWEEFKSKASSIAVAVWVGAIRRQGFVPTQNTKSKSKVCAVDTLCLELQLVTQASLTIFQQSTWGMKNSVAREEQRQVQKPDTELTVT